MARKRDRVFAGFGAILFLVTSVGLSIFVVWQMYQDSHQKDSSASTATAQTDQQSTKGKSEGTMLKDFTPVDHIDALQSTDLTVGDGAEVKPGDTVTVDYTGAVAATGKIFQSSLDSGQPVSFPLSQVIPGWQEGIPGMKINGVRRLLIPAAKAYGANPPQGSGIPANADLVFDVTLHKIGQ